MKQPTIISRGFLAVLFAALSCLATKAGPVEIDGIWYTIYPKTETFSGAARATARPDNQPYKLKDIVIPDSIEYDNYKLEVTEVDEYAFANCEGLETVTLGNNIRYVWRNAFYNTTVKNIVFPEKEVYIRISALCNCPNLETIVFNSEMTCLEADGFDLMAKNIVFKGNSSLEPMPTGISGYDPSYSRAASADEKEAASDMRIDWGEGNHNIYGMGLTWFTGEKLTLSGRTRIDAKYIDVRVRNITTLELEKKIERDDDYSYPYITAKAFQYADKLTAIICYDPEPWPIEDLVFRQEGQKENITVWVPKASLEAYRNDPAWGTFSKFRAIEGGVEPVEADDINAPVEYFNLNGVKLTEPASGSTVIRRQGSTVSKVLIP